MPVEQFGLRRRFGREVGLYSELFFVLLQLGETAGDFAFELLLERIQGVDVSRQARDVGFVLVKLLGSEIEIQLE